MRHTRVFNRNERPTHTFLSCFQQGLPVIHIAMHNRALLPHVFTVTKPQSTLVMIEDPA